MGAACDAIAPWLKHGFNVTNGVPGAVEQLGRQVWPTARKVSTTMVAATTTVLARLRRLPDGAVPDTAARRRWLERRFGPLLLKYRRALGIVDATDPQTDSNGAFDAGDRALRMILPDVYTARVISRTTQWLREGAPLHRHQPAPGIGAAYRTVRECRWIRAFRY